MATITEPTLLDQLRDQRSKRVEEWAKLIDQREKVRGEFEAREDKQDSDVDEFRVAEDKFKAESELREAGIVELDERIRQHDAIAERRADAAKASTGDVRITAEPLTYNKYNERSVSYFADLAAVQVPGLASRLSDPDGARERLMRHASEMDVELPKRAQARERRAVSQIDGAERAFTGSHVNGPGRRGLDASPFERRVNPNRTTGQGGYLVKVAA